MDAPFSRMIQSEVGACYLYTLLPHPLQHPHLLRSRIISIHLIIIYIPSTDTFLNRWISAQQTGHHAVPTQQCHRQYRHTIDGIFSSWMVYRVNVCDGGRVGQRRAAAYLNGYQRARDVYGDRNGGAADSTVGISSSNIGS